MATDEQKTVVSNRRALRDYAVLDRVEAGIALVGTEVKSVREGKVSLGGSYAEFRPDGLYVIDMHISPYSHGNRENKDPLRPRKLLLNRSELRRMRIKVEERGYTIIPLRLYFAHNLAKLELGLCKGKRQFDKREVEKERDIELEIARAKAERNDEDGF
jgi:SsrA-binding protein